VHRPPGTGALAPADLEALLAVTRGLAAPFELHGMRAEVARAACRLLRAERASVWLLEYEDGDGRPFGVDAVERVPQARLPGIGN
jgi:hypothetical protein